MDHETSRGRGRLRYTVGAGWLRAPSAEHISRDAVNPKRREHEGHSRSTCATPAECAKAPGARCTLHVTGRIVYASVKFLMRISMGGVIAASLVGLVLVPASARADGFAVDRCDPAEQASEWFVLDSLD